MKILIADDNATMRALLQHTIEKIGVFEIDIATDGVDALRVYREKRHDLLIVDNYMPKMDGIDVLKEIKYDESIKSTHVMLMTGRASKELVSLVRAEKIKIDDFIAKPFDNEKFREKVSGVFEKYRRRKRENSSATAASQQDKRHATRYSEPKLAVKTHLGVLRTINWSTSGVLLGHAGEVRFVANSIVPSKIVALNRPPPFEAKLSVVLDDPQRAVVVMKFVDLSEQAIKHLESLVAPG